MFVTLRRPSRRTTPTRPGGQEPHRRRAGRVRDRVHPLALARELVELYAEKGDPKYERAALKYLARFVAEDNPSLTGVAQVAALLAERGLMMRAGWRRPNRSAVDPSPAVPGTCNERDGRSRL